MAVSIPLMQLEDVMSDWHVELFRAYSAPTRVAPSSTEVFAASKPKSAMPNTSAITIGAASANSVRAVPSGPRKLLLICGTSRLRPCCFCFIDDLSWLEQSS
jgi:hypothetical protein